MELIGSDRARSATQPISTVHLTYSVVHFTAAGVTDVLVSVLAFAVLSFNYFCIHSHRHTIHTLKRSAHLGLLCILSYSVFMYCNNQTLNIFEPFHLLFNFFILQPVTTLIVLFQLCHTCHSFPYFTLQLFSLLTLQMSIPLLLLVRCQLTFQLLSSFTLQLLSLLSLQMSVPLLLVVRHQLTFQLLSSASLQLPFILPLLAL